MTWFLFFIFIASVAAGFVFSFSFLVVFLLVFFFPHPRRIIEILSPLHCCTVAAVHFTQGVHFVFVLFFFPSAHSLCCYTVERNRILRRNLLTNKALPLLLITQDQVLTGTAVAEEIRAISQLLTIWEAHCHRLQKEKSWKLLISPGWYCCMNCTLAASKRNGWICNSWMKLNHIL